MRELTTPADFEDAEFEDRPMRALARRDARPFARYERDEHDERDEPTVIRETSPWMPLALGLGIIALVGVAGVVVYLLVRRKDDGSSTVLGTVDPRYLPQPAPAAAPAAPQVFVINTGNGSASAPTTAPALPAATAPAELESVTGLGEAPLPPFHPSATPFYQRLSSIDSNTPAERLVTAGAHALEVVVHVVEPRGATAVLAFTPNALHTSSAIILPSGQERRIRVDRHQTLYAKGRSSVAAGQVILSVAAAA
jgi:hypothetical protein